MKHRWEVDAEILLLECIKELQTQMACQQNRTKALVLPVVPGPSIPNCSSLSNSTTNQTKKGLLHIRPGQIKEIKAQSSSDSDSGQDMTDKDLENVLNNPSTSSSSTAVLNSASTVIQIGVPNEVQSQVRSEEYHITIVLRKP